jgi:hypothetical protein
MESMTGLFAPPLTSVAVLVTIPRSILAPEVTFGFTVVCIAAAAVAVIGALRRS